jgi:hypothetical protein
MFKILIISSLSIFLFSCASTMTIQDQYQEASSFYRERNFTAAAGIIESYREISYKEKDRVLYYLDTGMLYHYSEEYEKSNEALTLAEQGIEDLYTSSISKALTSGLINDNVLEYSGEDYEDIYINIFKALNYMSLSERDSALVEIRKVHIKLNILEDKYRELVDMYNASGDSEGQIVARKNRFHNDALARYLGLLLYRADNSYDDARIEADEIEKAFSFQSQLYNFEKPVTPVLKRAKNSAYLSVVAFSGNSPRKLAETFYLQTTPDIVWIAATSQNEEYVKEVVGFDNVYMPGVDGGFHFKFQYPRMEMMGSIIDRIELEVDGIPVNDLELIEKMESISKEIFMIKQPFVIGKTIIRTVVKNILKEKGKKEMKGENVFLNILMGAAADAAVDATENADLRISPYFPAYASVLDTELPPGEHTVSITYYSGGVPVFRDDKGIVNISEKGINLVESFFHE